MLRAKLSIMEDNMIDLLNNFDKVKVVLHTHDLNGSIVPLKLDEVEVVK